MAKYIIDIPESGHIKMDSEKILCNTENGTVFIHCDLDYLTPYTEPDREAIENEVWDLAQKLGDMNQDQWISCFGVDSSLKSPSDYDYQEARVKYQEWKAKKAEIRVGDEVEYECGGIVRFVVFGIVGNTAYGFKYPCDYDDVSEYCDIDMLTKTGRHFDSVEKLLEEMRGESDD